MLLGCNKAVAESEEKDDSHYFLAVKAENLGKEKESEELYIKGISLSATSLVSRRCIEKCIELSSDKESYISLLLDKYTDDNALLTACNFYTEQNNFDKVLELTKDISVETSNNELVKLRLLSLIKKNNPAVHTISRTWFLSRPYSKEHQTFFGEYKAAFASEDTDIAAEKAEDNIEVMGFRNEIFRLSYGGAYSYIESGKIREMKFDFTDELMSDMGKACLYGKKDSYKSLPMLQKYLSFSMNEVNEANKKNDSTAQNNSIDDAENDDTEQKGLSPSHKAYYYHFYTGRILERAGRGKIAASEEYKKALDYSFSDYSYDNALWYYLNAILGSSAQNAVIEAEKFADKWHDAEYFDDFLDTLCIRLITNKNWKAIYRAYIKMSEYMSDELASQFAYISARLIDTKRLTFTDIEDVWTVLEIKSEHIYKDLLEVSDTAYRRALKSGIRPYYSVCAAWQLDDDDILFSDIFYQHKKTKEFKRDIEAETLLLGYLKFGLVDEMYSEWLNLRNGVSLEVAAELAEAYQKSGTEKDDRYSKALRIVSYAANKDWSTPSKKATEQLFPRNFLDIIQEEGSKYSVSESLLLGLIKSESYFDPTVSSSAGATGLTQLMDSTANDVARKLKMQPFDLSDAKTNIAFGTYYISELTRRLDNSKILALFAYNGGITHVKNWRKSAKLEYGENLVNDLFLEALPFAETREYGRKVVGAAAVYAYLYYGKSTASVVSDIMK